MARRKVPRPFTMPWGRGQISEEASILCPHWEPTIQLMHFEEGYRAIRFCYYHGPQFGRGPMILDEGDLQRMGEALREAPRLRAMLERVLAASGPPKGQASRPMRNRSASRARKTRAPPRSA